MRALTISEHGGLDRVQFREDLEPPELRTPTDVLVRMRAAALNHLDLFVVAGLPGVRITPPWILGADGTGVVDAVGDAVTSVVVGDRVLINAGVSCRECAYCRSGDQPLCPQFGLLGEHRPGIFAERVVIPATNVRRIPAARAAITDAEAAAFTLVTLTAWRMLVTRARVRPGEDVLIQGIGGGVAIAALLIAKSRGARVWATSSRDEKLAKAATLGADETLNYTSVDVAREVRARTGKRGVDVAIDSVGTATWAQSLGALGRGGRLVTCGATSGAIVETDVRKLFWNQWSLMGSTMGSDAEFDAIVAELGAGRPIIPVDSVYPLARGREALEHLAHGTHFGKVVLSIADD
ncbi:MAG: zinc-binding dehydrogenase [Gemmatimonadales bacterium]